MTDTIDRQDSEEQTVPTEQQTTQEQGTPTEPLDGGQGSGPEDARGESRANPPEHREGAPTPPTGMETVAVDNTPQDDVSAGTAVPGPAEVPAQGQTPVKEKKPWPKTQRGLIILVVVLALVLGFAGGVAGSAVIQFTGIFQQQPEMDSSDQGGDMGGMSDQMPEGEQGQMGEAPEGDATGTDDSDSSSDSDTATGSFTA